MKFGKIFEASAAAAALAACSPAEKAPDNLGLDTTESASVMKDNGDGSIDITLPQEEGAEDAVVPESTPQYTPEQEAEILSGTTQEIDSMNDEDLAKLKSSE
jgi:hypothetical protein